ncbi:MAG: tandem-95 repeat protein, partial [Psychrobium sp.]|nr:tandem-95 repeat protein [Psychrobium sp.]
DQLTVTEDSANNAANVTANDYTLSGGSLSYALVSSSNVNNGSLIFNNDGTYLYTPNANYFGNDNFSYTVSDVLSGESLTKGVTIKVSPVIDLIARNDSLTVNEDSIDNAATVASNDETTSGGSLYFTLDSDVSNGTLHFNIDGSYTYLPHPNYAGNDSFSYQAFDVTANETATITVSITVVAVDDLTAGHDTLTVIQDSSKNKSSVAKNDNTTSGASLLYELTNDIVVQHGSLTFNPDGSYSYIPSLGYFGTDSFSYSVTDPITGEVFVRNVTITVTEKNKPPVANNDDVQTAYNTAVTIAVLANDTDSDMADNPSERITIIGATAKIGTVTWDNQQLTYTPALGFDGIATVKYQIQDSHGATDQAVVYIDVAVASNAKLPTIILPDDVFSDANALFTKLDLGTATATDRFGNPLPVSLIDGITFYEPGINTAYWQATDADGNVAVSAQSVKVRPLVSLDIDQTVLEGFQVSVGVHLNGASPIYPLDIPFTVSGSALSGLDHDLIDGFITIESGSEGVIKLATLQDLEFDDGETITIELSDSLNRGNKYSHTITISEHNVAPDLKLIVTQQNQQRLTVTTGSPVVISSEVYHPIANKEFSYQWSSAQSSLLDTDNTPATFSFDTTDLSPGLYYVTLKVTDLTDSNYFDEEFVYIEVVEQLAVLTLADSDLDGIPDIVEGYSDNDGDGIADYLDAVSECNVLPEQAHYLEGYFVEGDPGVCLRRGDFTIGGETSGAQITLDDIASDDDDLLIEDPDAENIGGIFDYIAYGLPDAGQNYKIVMPQIKPIPANAVYRKLMPTTGWVTFTPTSNDQVLSTLGEPGFCPPPGGDVWNDGLTEGHWCVQLIIADGGINDADGLVNSTIVDPGGVGVLLTSTTNEQPIAINDSVKTDINTSSTIDVLINDKDPENAQLVITSASALFGEVVIIDSKLVYSPSSDFIGSDIITYGISDLAGGTDLATVTVTIVAIELRVRNSGSMGVMLLVLLSLFTVRRHFIKEA